MIVRVTAERCDLCSATSLTRDASTLSVILLRALSHVNLRCVVSPRPDDVGVGPYTRLRHELHRDVLSMMCIFSRVTWRSVVFLQLIDLVWGPDVPLRHPLHRLFLPAKSMLSWIRHRVVPRFEFCDTARRRSRFCADSGLLLLTCPDVGIELQDDARRLMVDNSWREEFPADGTVRGRDGHWLRPCSWPSPVQQRERALLDSVFLMNEKAVFHMWAERTSGIRSSSTRWTWKVFSPAGEHPAWSGVAIGVLGRIPSSSLLRGCASWLLTLVSRTWVPCSKPPRLGVLPRAGAGQDPSGALRSRWQSDKRVTDFGGIDWSNRKMFIPTMNVRTVVSPNASHPSSRLFLLFCPDAGIWTVNCCPSSRESGTADTKEVITSLLRTCSSSCLSKGPVASVGAKFDALKVLRKGTPKCCAAAVTVDSLASFRNWLPSDLVHYSSLGTDMMRHPSVMSSLSPSLQKEFVRECISISQPCSCPTWATASIPWNRWKIARGLARARRWES